MSTYAAAVIGCGSRGTTHGAALARCPRMKLVAAADLAIDKVRKFCETYQVPRSYGTMDELLAREEPQVVTFIAPPNLRRPFVQQIAHKESVRAILIEKPMEIDLADAEAMVQTCRDRGVLLVISHQSRFMTEFLEARAWVEQGRIGQLECLRATSKGNLTAQGTHMIDLLQFYLNDREPLWVMGQIDGGIETGLHRAAVSAAATISYDDHLHAYLEAGLRSPHHHPDPKQFWLNCRLEVHGQEGALYVDWGCGLRALLSDGSRIVKARSDLPRRDEHLDLVSEIADVLDGKTSSHRCSAENGLRAHRILSSIYRSAHDRRAVGCTEPGLSVALKEITTAVGAVSLATSA
ncbi:MAG: Gfo/Idh/MocA family oxidoreductase [Planctomycetes bacterium]|nr:Gfo/Idh/MocA family oxidoreductase [Planctomycetota bacterium]